MGAVASDEGAATALASGCSLEPVDVEPQPTSARTATTSLRWTRTITVLVYHDQAPARAPVADLRWVRYSLPVVPLPVSTLPVGPVVMLLGIGVGVMSLRRWPRAFNVAVGAMVVGAVVLVVGIALR